MNKCIFCEIYKNSSDIFKKYKFFFVNPDMYPVNFGHFEIIPIRHIVSIIDLNKEEWEELFFIIKNLRANIKTYDFKSFYKKIIEKGFDKNAVKFCSEIINQNEKISDFNLGINEGRLAGRTVDHLHIHIIPRYKGDCEDPTGGVRAVVKKKMNYKK